MGTSGSSRPAEPIAELADGDAVAPPPVPVDEPRDPGPSGALSVAVLWDDGTAIAGAVVRVGRSYVVGARETAEALTNPEGIARLEGVRPGPRSVQVVHDGVAHSRTVTVNPGRTAEAVFEIPLGVTVHGRASRGGSPVAGNILLAELTREIFVTGRLDPEGRFTLEHVPAGEYADRVGQSGVVACIAVPEAEDVWRSFELGVVRVRGVVSDALTREPVPGAVIRITYPKAYRRAVESDEEGRFQILDLPSGTYRASVTAKGHGVTHGVISVPECTPTDWSVFLRPGATIRLCLRDTDGNPVLEPVAISVIAAGRSVTNRADPDEFGILEIHEIPPGDCEIGLSRQLVRTRMVRKRLSVRPGENHFEIVLPGVPITEEQRAKAWVSGQIVDSVGRGIGGATILVAGPVTRMTYTDSKGRFWIGEILEGRYLVRATRRGFAAADERSVPLGKDGRRDLRLVLPRAVPLLLRLRCAGGTPVVGPVRVEYEAGGTRHSHSLEPDPDGHASLERLAPGEYQLRFSSRRFGAVEVPCRVEERELSLDVVLPGR